jgi:hypothetical protein
MPEEFPPGHFYSPIPDLDQVREREAEIFSCPRRLPGIVIDDGRQLALLQRFSTFYGEMPFTTDEQPGLRYRFDNGFFSYGDGVALYGMLRHLRPRRILEIGSGWSSALMLDVNDLFFDGRMECTFVEPFPDRLDELLTARDHRQARVIREPLHRADRSLFAELAPGDVLFVDSTHVSKVGSDVNQLVLDVLPTLRGGVHVHFHDILYPFEYPRDWVFGGRAWNEAYLLRAYLTDNARARITWFNSYLAAFHRAEVERRLPLWSRNTGGSLWFELG